MQFSLLGPLSVRQDGRTLALGGAKRRALLAALLFQANRVVSQRGLQDALWGEEPPATAADSLRNHLARLRLTLGAEGPSRLTSTPRGVLLRVAEGESDVHAFTDLTAQAQEARARRDWRTTSRRTGAALALWRGEPLSDLPDLHGLAPEVRHLGQARLQTLEWHFEAELHLGRHAEMILDLHRWAARHPLHENLHALLITALHRSGRQAEALEAFEAARAALADEFGADPGPALRAAHQQVLTGAPAFPSQRAGTGSSNPYAARPRTEPSAAVPPAGEPVSTGPHEKAETSEPSGTDRPPAQLPADTHLFTGRQQELRHLCELLEQAANGGGPRAVTVTGMGGVGKSALAVHAAHLLRDRFPDGQLHLDLRGFGTGIPRTAHDTLAILLADLRPTGASPQTPAVPDDTERRAALLRTELAERRLLLVLDNARDSEQILPLLPGTGASAVIITSRNTLTGLPAAHHLPLAPMDVEEQRALLTALCGSERVERDLDGALRVLVACAGLPLALRIAGARLATRPAWPLTALADRLAADGPGRLTALSTGRSTVRATFASSYLALHGSDEQTEREAARAFRLLGLCPQLEMTPAGAAALLDRTPAEAGDLLEDLVDTHLLQTPAPLRYRLHDLLAEYATERAHTDETPQAREDAVLRLGTWYALALDSACDAMGDWGQAPPRPDQAPPAPLPSFTDETQAIAWCRQELPNIGEVIRYCGEGPRPDLAWYLAVRLRGYMRTHWWTCQWEDHLNHALRIAEQHDDRLGRAWVLRTLGVCHGMASRTDQSIQALHEALRFAESECPQGTAAICANLSMAYNRVGQGDEALRFAREGLERHRRTGDDPQQTAFHTSALADALRVAGRCADAEVHYREALLLWRECGDANSTAITLANLGDTLGALGRRGLAFSAFQEALDITERIGNIGFLADTLVVMARTHVRFAEWAQARTRALQAIELGNRHRLGDWLSEAHALLDDIEKAGCGTC